jgi:hypothetical protein
MLTIDRRRCRFGCTYCFSDFSQYEQIPSLADVEATPTMLDGIDIVYPACDVDLFARRDANNVLLRCEALGRSISLSTKAELAAAVLDGIEETSARMQRHGQVLKVGVSMSTKSRVSDIEPGTADYEVRLSNLASLAERGVPRALILRPLLQEIDFFEYESMILDCSPYVDAVVFGGEWLEAGGAALDERSGVTWQEVAWLRDRPSWPHREDEKLETRLAECASSLGLRVFDSDLLLMQALLDDVVQPPGIEPVT